MGNSMQYTYYVSALEIIKRINSPNLKLMLDVFHLQQICGDISHSITNFMPYIGHVQVIQVAIDHTSICVVDFWCPVFILLKL